MDRVQFLHKIQHNEENNINIIKDFFEQYMLLYDITEKNNYDVTILSVNNVNGEFKLDFKSEVEINNLISNFQSSSSIYNKLFYINYSRISPLSLIIYIKQVS